MEKLYRVGLHGLTPHTYTEEYAVIIVREDGVDDLLSLSGVRLTNAEVFAAIYEAIHGREERLGKLLGKLRKLLELRDRVRKAKKPEDVRRDVWLKLGYRRSGSGRGPSPGSDYVLAEVAISTRDGEVFKEEVLVHVPRCDTRSQQSSGRSSWTM